MAKDTEDRPFDPLAPIGDMKVSTSEAIAAVALTMAMRFHDITTVQDGTLYQQYKLEGRNLVPLQLDMVLETARQIEAHLLGASDRIARIVVEAIAEAASEDKLGDDAAEPA